MKNKKADIYKIVGVIIFLAGWEIIGLMLGPTRLPTPVMVAKKFVSLLIHSPEIVAQGAGGENIRPHLIYTVERTFSGALTGIIIGIGIGLVMGFNRTLRLVVEPLIELIRVIPPLAIIPFLLMWFGPSPTTQYLMISFYCFLILTVTTLNAISNIQKIYIEMAQTMGANSLQITKTIFLPGIIPEMIGSIRVALAMSWGLEVVAELMGTPYGMGKVFSILVPFFATDAVIASILWIAFLAVITDLVINQIMRRLTKWQETTAT
jgi:ABC-type nitrate/sulfonate/bicarbonate transport system permease component